VRAVCASLAVLLALAACLACSHGEDTAKRRTSLDSDDRPNVVLVLTDDLDFAAYEPLGDLRGMLEGKGTRFDNAFVTTSSCCPARASILRGQYAHNTGIVTNRNAPDKFRSLDSETLPVWLKRKGYATFFGASISTATRGHRPSTSHRAGATGAPTSTRSPPTSTGR
jgi:N-acetylglucosamine-6-sulfatase